MIDNWDNDQMEKLQAAMARRIARTHKEVGHSVTEESDVGCKCTTCGMTFVIDKYMDRYFGWIIRILVSGKGRPQAIVIRDEMERIVYGTHPIFGTGEFELSDNRRVTYYQRAQGYIKQTIALLEEAGEFDDPALAHFSMEIRAKLVDVGNQCGNVKIVSKQRKAA